MICERKTGLCRGPKMTKNQKNDKKGQTLLEYALVAAIVAAAVIAMSQYVFRSVQSTQQRIHQEFQRE